MPLALIPDDVLASIAGLQILAIVYLAIAVSALRSQVAELRGRLTRHVENGER